MRIRSFVIPSLLVVVGSCGSTPDQSEPTGPSTPAAPAADAPPARSEAPAQASEPAVDLTARRDELAADFIANGDRHLAAGELAEAAAAFAQALEVMPENETALERMRDVDARMGESFVEASATLQGEEADAVRQAQARLAAERHVADGDRFRAAGDYDRAVQAYRHAEVVLRLNPLAATGNLSEHAVETRLASAIQEAEEAAQEQAQQERMEADQVREAREREQAQYRENKLRTLYAQANAAFQREQYGTAETLANQILLYDPGNETATELREIAKAARHQKTSRENDRKYRENWLRTFDELEMLGVPQVDTLVFNDLERWRKVSERKPYEYFGTDPTASKDKQAILDRLSELSVPARFGEDGDGAALEEVASYLQSVTGINFVVSNKVKDELDEDETSIYLDLPKRTVLNLLNIMTEVRENLRWKIDNGVVMFVTAEEMTGGQVLRMYEVRDLVHAISDFPGREINIAPSGGVIEFDEEVDEREALVITEDSLDSLIRDNIAPDSWDADPANSLRISNGTLVVNQTPEVHERISALLDDLREATGIMVDIQTRFLKVADNFLEDIGVDFKGLGSPGLGTNEFFDDFGDPTAQQLIGQELGTGTDVGAFYEDDDYNIRGRVENLYDSFLGNEDVLTGSGGLSVQWTYLNDLQLEMILRAVSKSERSELVTAPRLLVANTARSNVTVMNQVAYVQDFDVEIAQSASIADPQISVVQDGVILDVRPVVSADRRFITLELRPTVAELKRPIQEFTTSLGVSGNTVTIQLPELEISRVRTSVPMPDGGTVLLGGLKVHESQDFRSGVPILNKIPIVSFFFERKGTFISNQKLLILLKAQIIIPQEHEPTPAQLGQDADLALAPR